VQLLKHEYALLKDGKIEIRQLQSVKKSKQMPTYTLKLNNRKIKKVSLSLSEYGFINSREICRKVLEIISRSNITTVDPTNDKDLNDTREYIERLNKGAKDILDLNISSYHMKNIFDNSFFMSVNFFLSILENALSTEDFISKLFKGEMILTGSDDLYVDYISCQTFL
jgi:flagellar biosynthesis/type III secretory pathway chaperone